MCYDRNCKGIAIKGYCLPLVIPFIMLVYVVVIGVVATYTIFIYNFRALNNILSRILYTLVACVLQVPTPEQFATEYLTI